MQTNIEIPVTKKLTRKERRALREKAQEQKSKLELYDFNPLTKNQQLAFTYYENNNNLMLHGMAGTGKTFIALYLALQDIFHYETNYKKVYIVRSAVPTRDIGFLPGKDKDKTAVYEAPYQAICTELFKRGDAYEILKQKGIIEFVSTSFLRGITLSNCIVVVDELQNMSFHELDTIITRMGKNTRLVLSGDMRQTDLTKEQEKAGLKNFLRIIDKMKSFKSIEFAREDVVRSGLVKEYLFAKDDLNL